MREVGVEAFSLQYNRELELELGNSGFTKIKTLASPPGSLFFTFFFVFRNRRASKLG